MVETKRYPDTIVPNVNDLQKDVQQVLDGMRHLVEAASDLKWHLSDGCLPLVYRSILRRQFESLDVIANLVASGSGCAAPPLIRSSCEELIWVRYLTGIARADAEQLAVCVARDELLASLKAQDGYAGHATSRFVHFSVAELLRRVWGREGDVSIRSTRFRDYWGSFALYWGLRLFLGSTIELCKQPDIPTDGEMDEAEMILAAVKRVGEYGQVPIITAEELAWPT